MFFVVFFVVLVTEQKVVVLVVLLLVGWFLFVCFPTTCRHAQKIYDVHSLYLFANNVINFSVS